MSKHSFKWDERYLQLAKEVSTWSKDPSTKVGAIAVGDKGQVLSQGYNGFPRGIKDNDRLSDKEMKYRYVVHAEMNCIYNATFHGTSLNGATLYVYGLPMCNECAKAIIQVGITRVVSPYTGNIEVPEKWKISCAHTQLILKEVNIPYQFMKMNK